MRSTTKIISSSLLVVSLAVFVQLNTRSSRLTGTVCGSQYWCCGPDAVSCFLADASDPTACPPDWSYCGGVCDSNHCYPNASIGSASTSAGNPSLSSASTDGSSSSSSSSTPCTSNADCSSGECCYTTVTPSVCDDCCGNSTVDTGEECDLGWAENSNPDSACTIDCKNVVCPLLLPDEIPYPG